MRSATARKIAVLCGLVVGLPGVSALAQAPTTAPATQPNINVYMLPTDQPVQKMNNQGVVDAGFTKKHEQFVEHARHMNVDLLFIGDSITEGWWWNDQHLAIWKQHFFKYHPDNFGIGGDRTEHVLWRITNGELDNIKPKVVVLLIGTNNIGRTAEDILKGDVKIVQTIHEKLPDAKVLVQGIFPREDAKTRSPGQAPTPNEAQNKEWNDKLMTVNEGLKKLDDGNKTRYIYFGDKFLGPDGHIPKDIMPDLLHVNAKGYEIWANAIDPVLAEMMK